MSQTACLKETAIASVNSLGALSRRMIERFKSEEEHTPNQVCESVCPNTILCQYDFSSGNARNGHAGVRGPPEPRRRTAAPIAKA